jgi:hypothetical protein
MLAHGHNSLPGISIRFPSTSDAHCSWRPRFWLANHKEHKDRKEGNVGGLTRQMIAPICLSVRLSLGSLRSLWLKCSV